MVAEAFSYRRQSSARYFEPAITLVLAIASLWLLSRFNSLFLIYYMHVSGYVGMRALMWGAIPLLSGLGFALIFSRLRYADFIPLMRFAIRSSAIGLLVYLIVEPPDFTVATEDAAARALYVRVGYFFALAAGAASVFLPSFTVPTAFFILSTRWLVESISGLTMSTLDIRYMLDMAIYLTLFCIPIVAIGPRLHPYFSSPTRQIEMTFVAFGLHLGNYFWSGVAKLLVGPHWWTWIWENKTYNTIPYALENGTLPIGHIPWLVDLAYYGMQLFATPLNLSIAGFQLLAIVCVLRMSWLKLASVFYDLLHLGIWLFGGLFFWPWVWNNFTILLAAKYEKATVDLPAKLACIITILLGYPALGLNQSAWLG